MLSVVRGYNILVIVLAQYLTSIYILSYDDNVWDVILNPTLFILVFSSSLVIAAGYIINAFYDFEKDRINKPSKTALDNLVSQRTKLGVYVLFNSVAIIISLAVSVRAAFFMLSYAFGIWMYSHKLKKITFIGNIVASLLAITPFFAIFLYYRHISELIVLHATFLYLLILIRELVKDLLNYNGDLIYGYQTIPVRYTLNISRYVISVLVFLTLIPGFMLTRFSEVGAMEVYFYFSMGVLFVFVIGLWYLKGVKWYLLQYNIIKLLILAGVFSIALVPY
ncbi:MAG: geranylgeranylglycerol-phosphate geranylgeranyltransferase [Bacteroidota bacterium]